MDQDSDDFMEMVEWIMVLGMIGDGFASRMLEIVALHSRVISDGHGLRLEHGTMHGASMDHRQN